MISISVVIPCYNEEKYIGLLLDDITKQTLQPTQVIIADSRSTDKTVETAQAYSSQLPIEITGSTIRTPGAARNAGAKLAQGDYIVFIDADTRISSTTFEQLADATDHGTIDFITPLYTTPGKHPVDQLFIKGINYWLKHPRTPKQLVPGIGALMFVRRPAHENINGFDDHLVKENDLEYLERLNEHPTSHKVLEDLLVESSNRRLIKDGRFVSILNLTPRNSWRGKHIVYPLLKKLDKHKKYGIF